MLVGRILGWGLILVTVMMASADAVLALGPADVSGIVAGDLLTLLTGGAPDVEAAAPSLLSSAETFVLDLPAWVVVGLMGTATLLLSRKRHRRYRFRR